MADGIVMSDDERVGTWTTLDRTGVVIDFDSDKNYENFLELTDEHGMTLSFLQAHPEDYS